MLFTFFLRQGASTTGGDGTLHDHSFVIKSPMKVFTVSCPTAEVAICAPLFPSLPHSLLCLECAPFIPCPSCFLQAKEEWMALIVDQMVKVQHCHSRYFITTLLCL
jgi:hypothetical protein